MSRSQYNALRKCRLTELHVVEPQLIAEYLADKPTWFRSAINKMIDKQVSDKK